MKVSILVITYNQEKYIAQAIEGVLMQEVSFDYEILVGEDSSTDHTREIVLKLEREHPDKIKVMLRDAADSERDRALGLGGKTNFVKGLQACRGEYVALLDGDDYWTDTEKLKKQVNFLDSQPDFAISFHNAEVRYEDTNQVPWNFCSPSQAKVSTLEDLLERNFIATSSTVFRRDCLGVVPSWFSKMTAGDWVIHILNAQNGKVGYLDEVMSVYRIHDAGFWSDRSSIQNTLAEIAMFKTLAHYLPTRHRRRIKTRLASLFYKLSSDYSAQGDKLKAIANAAKSLARNPGTSAVSFRYMLHIVFPGVVSRMKSLTRKTS